MPNPPIVLDNTTVSEHLGKLDVVQAMRTLFINLGEARAVQPPQTVTEFPGGGDFITYLGALEGAGVFGAKLSPYLPRANGPIITAWTVLMSIKDGRPLALIDAGVLTTERTAATTALAVDELAPTGRPLTLAIIGTGQVAQAHMRHVAGLRDWAEVRIYSPGLGENTDIQATWKMLCPNAKLASSSRQAIAQADVVMLCTSSGSPVISTEDIAVDALVTSISTNVARAHEVDPTFLASAQVYCDYRETTPDAAGEMLIAVERHNWSKTAILGDLAELCTGRCQRPIAGTPVFFRSVGLGLEDIAVAKAVFDQTSA